MTTNTDFGKAFEYACMMSIYEYVRDAGADVSMVASPALNTAQRAFDSLDADDQEEMKDAADTAVGLIVPLEPQLLNGDDTLELAIASDAVAIGADGDVRDVLCMRPDWCIGLSCKHNHEALRHPRITEGKDFGRDWMRIPCSREFIDEITPITDSLISYGRNRVQWNTIPNKQQDYYYPILSAYLDEIRRMCNANADVPARLLHYFFGANDFYKVVMKSSEESTTIEGFNMSGTLNQPCGRIRPRTRVPLLRMPTRLLDADFKSGSMTTIVLAFDGGWTISMRLHNKDRIARPTSLAWDVNLIGLPTGTYMNTHYWDE